VKKTWIISAIILVSGCLIGIISGLYLVFSSDLPQIRELKSYTPPGISRIYSSDKHLLAEIYSENREFIKLEDVPEYIKQGLLATEDRAFYSHSGMDLRGIIRALVKDIITGRFAEGASTLSQQLIRTLFLTKEKKLVRKIKEAILTIQLEKRYTKNEILELYFNQVNFGSGAYGIKAAARKFFGKHVDDLTLAECALIAGMPQAPSRISPLISLEKAEKRRNLVLRQMLKTGAISPDLYELAIREEIDISGRQIKQVKARCFINYLRPQIEEIAGIDTLYKKSLSIHTTLNLKMQEASDQSISKGLSLLKQRMIKNGIKNASPQAALIVIDLNDGAIRAMSGGENREGDFFNRAVSAQRQPGSAFKPFIYALAIEKGYKQSSILEDSPVTYFLDNQRKSWSPENFSHKFSGAMTMRYALSKSINIPAIRLADKIGLQDFIEFSHNLGIQSHLGLNLSLALGTSEVNLLELTSAYTVFPNEGILNKPYSIKEIMNQQKGILWKPAPEKKLAVSQETAAIVTDMLKGVILEGTGKKARVLPGSYGGKTGTTNDFKDALFIGFSTEIAVGIWVGNDSNTTLGHNETGAKAALPIWLDFMKKIYSDRDITYFHIPGNTVSVYMNQLTGKRSGPHSKQSVKALFLKGTEPL